MNIHEYQAKDILKNYNVPVPNGTVVYNTKDAENAAWQIETDLAVVKAQIHSGGRGKAGGIKLAKSIDDVKSHTSELLGKTLVTKQTGPRGKKVNAVLIEEGYNILKEYYLALVLDRESSKVVLMASEYGGMDIEEIAAENPDKIYKESIDPLIGLSEFQARRICFNINMLENLVNSAVDLILNLYKCFMEKDCTLAEINPLIITEEEQLIALDAKFNFDENSLFRNKDILKYRDPNEEDEKELEAAKYGLSYIALDGNIGCMVNGAGLAMSTMDIIKYYGGKPANFLDVGGSATEENVTHAFEIILSDDNVEGIFVNIFGGIMKCDVIAKGIVNAVKTVDLKVPLVVRLEGTNSKLGMEIIEKSNLDIYAVETMDQGARKIIGLI